MSDVPKLHVTLPSGTQIKVMLDEEKGDAVWVKPADGSEPWHGHFKVGVVAIEPYGGKCAAIVLGCGCERGYMDGRRSFHKFWTVGTKDIPPDIGPVVT